MMVTPVAVLPIIPAAASPEPIADSLDATAAAPFLAILAAAVAAPAPKPVTAVLPPPIPEAPVAEGDVEGETVSEGAYPASTGVDAAGETAVMADASHGRPTLALVERTAPGVDGGGDATHQATPSEAAQSVTVRGAAAEPEVEEAQGSVQGVEQSSTPVDAGRDRAIAASVATLISPLTAEQRSATPSTPDAPATPHRSASGSGAAAGGVPSARDQATAAGMLAALSATNVERSTTTNLVGRVVSGSAVEPQSASFAGASGTGSAAGGHGVAEQLLPSALVVDVSGPQDTTPPQHNAPAVARPLTAPLPPEVATPRAHAQAVAVTPATTEQTAPAPRAAAEVTTLVAREDAVPESAPAARAPWVATPTVLPEARGDAPDAGQAAPEKGPVRAEQAAPSHVTVELDPETAGASRVRVAVRGDVVHATVLTDASGVDAMRPQLGELRQALEGQGFREATVQLRTSGDGTAPFQAGGAVDVRARPESAATGEGSTPENHPRGRQRGHEHPAPDQRTPIDPDEEQT